MVSFPTLSVVMPARNSERHLGEALDALAAQVYPAWWEVIIISGGSTDRTVQIARSYRERLPHLQVLASAEPAIPAAAQNLGIAAASGEALVFLDSDDRVGPEYLLHLGRALTGHELVGGRVRVEEINTAEQVAMRRPLQDHEIERFCGYRPAVIGAAMAARRVSVQQVGGFDETLVTQQDLDLSWRLAEAGAAPAFAPEAVLHYRYRAGARQLLRQHIGYGLGEVRLFRKHAAAGMPRRHVGQIVMAYLRLGASLPQLRTAGGRNRVAASAGLLVGRLVGSARHRTLYL